MERMDTETAARMAAATKCAHAGCTCTVVAGERYCSDYCVEQVNARTAHNDDECQCGHPECEHDLVSAGQPLTMPGPGQTS